MSTLAPSDARIDFRLPSASKAEIERAAMMQNRSLTNFATQALLETARRVLAEQEDHAHVQLSNRDWERFLAMLDADPTPNAALRAAAKRYRKLIVK